MRVLQQEGFPKERVIQQWLDLHLVWPDMHAGWPDNGVASASHDQIIAL
jgi:hypothetical protein